MFEKMKDIVELAKKDAAKFMADNFAQTANITGIAMAIFVLVVIGYVSIFVVNEIHGIAGITAGSVFYTASNKVISVMNTSWGQKFWAYIKHLKQSIANVQISNSRVICEYLFYQNDAHRRYRLCGLKNVYTAGVSGVGRRDNCSNSWRARGSWRRNDVDKISIDYNKRGQSLSPTFIFST